MNMLRTKTPGGDLSGGSADSNARHLRGMLARMGAHTETSGGELRDWNGV